MGDNQMLSAAKLAALLDVSVETLKTWRRRGTGPQWTHVGAAVRYRWADVSDWLDAQNPQRRTI